MTDQTDISYHPLGAYDLHVLTFIITNRVVDFALYGVQASLSVAAITILARRQGRSRFTLAAILGLFLCSTISVVSRTVFYVAQIPMVLGTPAPRDIATAVILMRLDILNSVAHSFIYVLSDTVLVWRAWCLYSDNRLVKGILSLCIGGSAVGSLAMDVWGYWPGLTFHGDFGDQLALYTWLTPLLITNVVATVLIGTKVLQYRREIKGSLGLFSQRSQAETVLLILLESGLVYILFWVLDCATWRKNAKGDGFSSIRIFSSVSYHIAGIYPTCVLFAAMQGGTQSLLSAHVSQAMRFAGARQANEEARDLNADMTRTFQLASMGSASDDGSQDAYTETPGLHGTFALRSEEVSPESSGGIAEVERQLTVK
ncbi:hypothetical protein EV122DRAFT_212359 [Schizophyllum commune]